MRMIILLSECKTSYGKLPGPCLTHGNMFDGEVNLPTNIQQPPPSSHILPTLCIMTRIRHGLSFLAHLRSTRPSTYLTRLQLITPPSSPRYFSSQPPRFARTTRSQHRLQAEHRHVPDYPYRPTKAY